MARRPHLLTVALLAPLVLAGCAGTGAGVIVSTPENTPTVPPSLTIEPTQEAAAGQAQAVAVTSDALPADVTTAVQTALTEVVGTVVAIDSDPRGWSVSIVNPRGNQYDVELTHTGAGVLRGPVQAFDDADELAERTRLLAAPVDFARAIRASRTYATGAVTGLELSEEDGRAVWEVQLDEGTADEVIVHLDAHTAELVSVDPVRA